MNSMASLAASGCFRSLQLASGRLKPLIYYTEASEPLLTFGLLFQRWNAAFVVFGVFVPVAGLVELDFAKGFPLEFTFTCEREIERKQRAEDWVPRWEHLR